jgi:hypothetical protein
METTPPRRKWAFHGTDINHLAAIAQQGLQPSNGELWFTATAEEAATYAKEGLLLRFPCPQTSESRIRHVRAFTTAESVPACLVRYAVDQWAQDDNDADWVPISKHPAAIKARGTRKPTAGKGLNTPPPPRKAGRGLG